MCILSSTQKNESAVFLYCRFSISEGSVFLDYFVVTEKIRLKYTSQNNLRVK